jgi:hypothetical protein
VSDEGRTREREEKLNEQVSCKEKSRRVRKVSSSQRRDKGGISLTILGRSEAVAVGGDD